MKSVKMIISKNQLSQSQVDVTAFRGTEGQAQKSHFK
jgi:hypothetical protein